MKTTIGDWMARHSSNFTKPLRAGKPIALALVLGAAALSLGGCVAYPVNGYDQAYYEPDYGSYYGDYGYAGTPFDAGVYGGDFLIGGVRHHGYYGGHHFGHDFHGGGGGHFRGGGGHFGGGGGHFGGGGHGGGGGGHR